MLTWCCPAFSKLFSLTNTRLILNVRGVAKSLSPSSDLFQKSREVRKRREMWRNAGQLVIESAQVEGGSRVLLCSPGNSLHSSCAELLRNDTQWQAHTPGGIDASQFILDWENRQATCPQGKTSTSWSWVSRKSHPDLIRDPIFHHGLSVVPPSLQLCSVHKQLSTPNAGHQAPSSACCAPSCTTTAAERNLPADICRAGWG